MIKRTLIIRLKKDVPPERVRALVKTLEDAPTYIPVLTSSVVGKNLSGSPYEVIWEQGFDSLETLEAYWTNPYHCDKLDEFLWKECPSSIIQPPIIHIFFDDQKEYQV